MDKKEAPVDGSHSKNGDDDSDENSVGSKNRQGKKRKQAPGLGESEDTKEDEEQAAYIARKREASRVSSRRTREREKIKLEHFSSLDAQLGEQNKQLRAENQQLRSLINRIKETKMPPSLSVPLQGSLSDSTNARSFLQAIMAGQSIPSPAFAGDTTAFGTASAQQRAPPGFGAHTASNLAHNPQNDLLQHAASIFSTASGLSLASSDSRNQRRDVSEPGPNSLLQQGQQTAALLQLLGVDHAGSIGNRLQHDPHRRGDAAPLGGQVASNYPQSQQTATFLPDNQKNPSESNNNVGGGLLGTLRQAFLSTQTTGSQQQHNEEILTRHRARQQTNMNSSSVRNLGPNQFFPTSVSAQYDRLNSSAFYPLAPAGGVSSAEPARASNNAQQSNLTPSLSALAASHSVPGTNNPQQQQNTATMQSTDSQQQESTLQDLLTVILRGQQEKRR